MNDLNIKIIVATRPHLKANLEKILKRISFELLAFNESNQVDFLMQYWTTKHDASESESLREFSKKCLNTLSMKMTDAERHIAGIPLQCMMLAEVYAKDATRASELEKLPEDVIKGYSFFQLYQALITYKFQRIPDPQTRQVYMDAHVYDSLALLFPEWLEEFKPHLGSREKINETTMFFVGLVEKRHSSELPRFVHRTFAEYLFADFIVRNLLPNNEHGASVSVKFLIQEILTEQGELDHPAIGYFVEMHLQDRFKNSDNDLTMFAHLNTLNVANMTDEEACIAAVSCCYNSLETTFNLIAHVIKHLNIKDKELIDEYFIDLPHIVVDNTNSDSDSFLKKVLNFTKLELNANLSYHVHSEDYEFPSGLEIPNCTPLHVAVSEGKYNIFIFLLEEYAEDVLLLKHLLHVCVHGSLDDSESVIENKLSIIEAIVQRNSKWLDEELEGRTPLLQYNIHESVAKKLVELGANINACSAKCETVLHTMMRSDCDDPKTLFLDLLRWAIDNRFNSVNEKNNEGQGQTLLMEIIETFGTVDDDVLRMLHDKAHADFNQQDYEGDSVLIYAIRESESLHFIQQILDYGAISNHINNDGENAAHVAFSLETYNPNLALELFKLLKLKGFNGLNQKDNQGRTPCMLAIENGIIFDDEFIKFLRNEDVDFNAHDNDGDSVLLYALINSENIGFIEKIFGFNANPTHTNNHGSNAAHMIMRRENSNPSSTLTLLKLLKAKGFDGFNQSNIDGRTPIMDAIQGKITLDDEIIKFLEDEGAEFNAQDSDGNSVLFYALMFSKDIDFIQKILKFETNPNHKNVEGQNVGDIIIDLLENNIEDTVNTLKKLKLLVSMGFDGLNQSISQNGDFSLIISAVESTRVHSETLRLFFKTASETKDLDGDTILFHALQFFKNKDLVSTILAQGVNVNHQNKLGQNAAHYILKYKQDGSHPTLDMLTLLKSYQFSGFDQKDKDGRTPFMIGIKFGGIVEPGILEFFCEEKIDFHAEDNDGHSVLFYSIQYSRSYEFIQKMLNFGTNPNHKKRMGQNAAHLVLHSNFNDPAFAAWVLKLLKSKGFYRFTEKDDYGHTPLSAL